MGCSAAKPVQPAATVTTEGGGSPDRGATDADVAHAKGVLTPEEHKDLEALFNKLNTSSVGWLLTSKPLNSGLINDKPTIARTKLLTENP